MRERSDCDPKKCLLLAGMPNVMIVRHREIEVVLSHSTETFSTTLLDASDHTRTRACESRPRPRPRSRPAPASGTRAGKADGPLGCGHSDPCWGCSCCC